VLSEVRPAVEFVEICANASPSEQRFDESFVARCHCTESDRHGKLCSARSSCDCHDEEGGVYVNVTTSNPAAQPPCLLKFLRTFTRSKASQAVPSANAPIAVAAHKTIVPIALPNTGATSRFSSSRHPTTFVAGASDPPCSSPAARYWECIRVNSSSVGRCQSWSKRQRTTRSILISMKKVQGNGGASARIGVEIGRGF